MSNAALNDLPVSWEWTKLGDVVTNIIGGGTLSKNKPHYWDGSISWLTIKDMRSRCPADSMDHISELAVEESSTNVIPEDTVIIATRIGLGKVIQVPYKAAINQVLKALVVPPEIDKGYLKYWFVSKTQYLKSIGSDTTVKGIRLEQVRDLDFPLAPPEQQKCIVAKIEELFSHIDAGIEALKKAKQLLKQYRQSVLKSAVTDELTKEWLEPASQLLERILKERRKKWEEQQLKQFKAKGEMPKNDKWKEEYKEPFGLYEKYFELPEEGSWATVDQLGEVKLGRQKTPKNRSKDYPAKYIRAANLTEYGLDFTDLFDMEFKPGEFERYVMKANDLVLSKASGSPDQVGKPAIWKEDMPVCCFQNTVIRHRPNGVEPRYLLIHYKYFYWCEVFSRTDGGVGINHLSAQKFLKMSIALPPQTEKKEIVKKVYQNIDVLARLDAETKVQLIKADKNKQSILASAFTGEMG